MVDLIGAAMKRIGTEPVPAVELAARKAVLIGSFGRRTETDSGIADILSDYILQSVPLSEFGRYSDKNSAVTASSVQATVAALFNPAAASIVVVGHTRQFLTQLRKAHPR